WGPGRQVDIGPATIGRDRNIGVALAVSGDGTVHVVWGNGDRASNGAIYASMSTDYGMTWQPPRTIATGCSFPSDLASTLDGQVVALLFCGFPAEATFVLRHPNGSWGVMERTGERGGSGSLVVVGDGSDAQALAMVTSFVPGGENPYTDIV